MIRVRRIKNNNNNNRQQQGYVGYEEAKSVDINDENENVNVNVNDDNDENNNDENDDTNNNNQLFTTKRKVNEQILRRRNNNNDDPLFNNLINQQQQQEDDDTTTTINNTNYINTNIISIDDAIERLGYGNFQRKILVCSGLCFCSDSIQIMLLSFLTRIVQVQWELSLLQTSILTSSIFAGAFTGTLILGPLADVYGRRILFLCSGIIIIIFSFIGIAILTPYKGYYILVLMIYGVGFGIGGLTVPFDIFAECLPVSIRGQQLLFIEYFWSIGGLFVVLIAQYTFSSSSSESLSSSATNNDNNWRIFVAICSIPCILSVLLGYFFVPESPRWLLSKYRMNDALFILRKAAYTNGHTYHDIDTNLFPISIQIIQDNGSGGISTGDDDDSYYDDTIDIDSTRTSTAKVYTIIDLFQPKWRNITIRLWGTWCTMAFGYYGTILAITRVFESSSSTSSSLSSYTQNSTTTAGVSFDNTTSTVSTTSSIDFDYNAIFVSNAAEIIGTTLIIVTIDRFGRINTQIISFALAGICVCLLTILSSYIVSSNSSDFNETSTTITTITTNDNNQYGSYRIVLVLLGFCSRVFEMAGSCATWVMTAEVLSTEIRSTGHSAANAVARIGAFVCPYIIINFTLVHVGIIMLFVHTCTVLFVSGLPETSTIVNTTTTVGTIILPTSSTNTTTSSFHDIDTPSTDNRNDHSLIRTNDDFTIDDDDNDTEVIASPRQIV